MMPLSAAFYRRVIQRLQHRLDAEPLDGLLLLNAHNVVYASGFTHSPSERPIGLYVPKMGDPVLFVPLLEQENAAQTWIGDIRVYFEYPGEEHPVLWMLRECNAARIGVDELGMDVLRRAGEGVTLTPIVERMRWVKRPEELALIEQAAHYADFCLQFVRDHAPEIIRSGGTELDILNACLAATHARLVADQGARFGRRGLRVTGTVHSGPRAALPHGEPVDRRPQPGEPLIAGIGVMLGGYHAESGATFLLGEARGDQQRVLDVMAAADSAAATALKPGNTCAAVNEAALGVLRAAGFGAAIRHRIGHGMGLQGHEAPWLAPGDTTVLAPGMVFSSEPGIYRPDQDGYRTINTLIVTPGEVRVASRFQAAHPAERRILPL